MYDVLAQIPVSQNQYIEVSVSQSGKLPETVQSRSGQDSTLPIHPYHEHPKVQVNGWLQSDTRQ